MIFSIDSKNIEPNFSNGDICLRVGNTDREGRVHGVLL